MKLEVAVTDRLKDVERRLILGALAHHGDNKRATARSLGISLKTMYNKLNRYSKPAP